MVEANGVDGSSFQAGGDALGAVSADMGPVVLDVQPADLLGDPAAALGPVELPRKDDGSLDKGELRAHHLEGLTAGQLVDALGPDVAHPMLRGSEIVYRPSPAVIALARVTGQL